MEAKVSQGLQLPKWTYSEKTAMMPSHSLGFSQRVGKNQRLQVLDPKKSSTWHRPVELKVSCTQMFPASVLESGRFPATFEEDVLLKNKSEEIEVDRTEGVSYCDKLIEQAVGGIAVADIFKLHGESFFRNHETAVLRKLSSKNRLFVSTGGGAVICPINWKYMQKGISVWLDVPLDALARRIAKEGTNSRLLVHEESDNEYESDNAYTKTLARLSMLWKERSEPYINNANARVLLENIAAKMGYGDVFSITPNQIAFEALVQIEAFLKK